LGFSVRPFPPSGKIADNPGIVPAFQIGFPRKEPLSLHWNLKGLASRTAVNDVWTCIRIRNPKRAIVYDLDGATKPMAFYTRKNNELIA
jgi:hypothetical protein